MYDINGNLIMQIAYTGAGTDGNWLTADDDMEVYTNYSCDANGPLIRGIAYFGPGPTASGCNAWCLGDFPMTLIPGFKERL